MAVEKLAEDESNSGVPPLPDASPEPSVSFTDTTSPELSSSEQCRAAQARQLQVCQNRTCLRSQSDKILTALQSEAPSEVMVMGCGCLGQCGAGPIVQVSPDNIWYCRVATKADVLEIVEQHLIQDQPVQRLLHPRIHAYYIPDVSPKPST
ncbi:MAG: (2Fe-2S) ferredoxin domain-containing protein [Cyanobacteria bacterium J06632_22]